MGRKRISTEIANCFDKNIDRLTHVDISYSEVGEAVNKARLFLARAGILDGDDRMKKIIRDMDLLKKMAQKVRAEAGKMSPALKKDPSLTGPEGFPMQGSKREIVDFFRIAIGEETCDELLETPLDGIHDRIMRVFEELNPAHIDREKFMKQLDLKFDRKNVAETDRLILEIKRTR